MSKALLLHIDGCRVDTLQAAKTPNIDKLFAAGAWTLNAQTITPPMTLPVHFSIFTSLNAMTHRVLSNAARPSVCPSAVGLIEWLKSHGKTTAMYYNWEFLRELSPPGSLNSSIFLDTMLDKNGDILVAKAALEDIITIQPDFAFIYLGVLDEVGHAHGFESDEYTIALKKADEAVGYILDTLNKTGTLEEYTIFFESDHGGIDKDHFHTVPEVMTVPWCVCGPNIQAIELSSIREVSVMDTIPTIAYIMNIPLHPNWKGRVVTEAILAVSSEAATRN